MIREKPGGRFEVFVQGATGQKKYVGTFYSRREAEEQEQEAQVTQRKIKRGELAPSTDTRRTFGAAAKLWYKDLEEKQSRSEYKARIDLHAMPTFEHVPLIDIRKENVREWRDKLSARKMSAPTVNNMVACLSSAFTFFVDRGWIEVNPCRGIKPLATETKVYPWLQSSEMITKLLSECTPNIRSLVAFLVGTGARLQEALELKWQDVNLEHRLVTLRKTKGRKVRHVPIFDSVLVLLKQMKLQRGTNALLWPGGKPGKPRAQPSVHLPFKRALDHAELPTTMRLHDLRHTFASLFLADGGDIFKLSRILGHSSVAITEKTYAHLKPTAYEEDYGRVRFDLPSDAPVLRIAG